MKMILKTALATVLATGLGPLTVSASQLPQPKPGAPVVSSSLMANSLRPPAVSVSMHNLIYGQVACNARAKTALLVMGATSLGLSNGSTANWAVVGPNQVMVWCQSGSVFIVVAGNDQTMANQLREDIAVQF